jgi:hypothetical protein
MSTTCPVCGAILPNGTTCREFFDQSQLKEIEQPEYYA